MSRAPSLWDTSITVVAGALAVVGMWLPWVRKLPTGYANGEPMYTLEPVPQSETGFQHLDPVIVLLVGLVVAGAILLSHWDRRPGSLLVTAGGLMLFGSGFFLQYYVRIDRYAVEPGVYLVIVSGLLFVLLGAAPVLKRRVLSPEGNGGNPRIG